MKSKIPRDTFHDPAPQVPAHIPPPPPPDLLSIDDDESRGGKNPKPRVIENHSHHFVQHDPDRDRENDFTKWRK